MYFRIDRRKGKKHRYQPNAQRVTNKAHGQLPRIFDTHFGNGCNHTREQLHIKADDGVHTQRKEQAPENFPEAAAHSAGGNQRRSATDAYGNPDLGINASNEEYLERHPYASREYYSLCNFDMSEVEIVDQMELPGMSMGGM